MSYTPPESIREEASQAKARLGVCLFALAYVAGWSAYSGPVRPLIIWVLLGYTVFSGGWMLLIRARPTIVPWRRALVIVGDLGINTFFMHMLQAKGAFFYPMYLWIIVGNGVRYGPRYLLAAMAVGVAYFGPMLAFSSYWRTNAVAGSGLLAGLIVLPLFYLSLIRNLHTANARLREEVDRSQAASRAKTAFLANMSHELRTPMSGVLGVTELMRMTPLSPSQTEHLDLIQRSANSLLKIIDDVLELSKIEAAKVRLKKEPLDLKQICEDVYHLLRPNAEQKGLDLRLSFAADATRDFLGDSTRIRQILFNLTGNAIKFTDRGHVTLDLRTDSARVGPVQVYFRVIDTGIGIHRDQLSQIFDKFEQAESPEGRRSQGTGLGLAISRHLAELMNGEISVDSEIGKGSTFTVVLSLEPNPEPPKSIAPQPQPGTPLASALRVLVVEDNPVNQLIIRSFLERLEASVVVTEAGESALAILRQQTFDLVFMDIQLPDMDGLEVTRRIRNSEGAGRRVPVVALTANAFVEDREASLAAGMDLHLRKPIQLSDLELALETLRDQGLLEPAPVS